MNRRLRDANAVRRLDEAVELHRVPRPRREHGERYDSDPSHAVTYSRMISGGGFLR